jgi:hypothetical protein
VPFNPTTVTNRVVGTMTWVATSTSNGTLTYTVDGVSVTVLTRQTLVFDDFSGNFQGAIHRAASGCSSSVNNTTTELSAGFFINQANNTTMSINTSDALGAVCNYSGTLSQAGQMGSISGTYNCNNGDGGTFNMFELQVNISGITGRFAQNSDLTACVSNGWFGDAKRALKRCAASDRADQREAGRGHRDEEHQRPAGDREVQEPQLFSAHSPLPSKTLRSTSVKGSVSSM